MIGGADLWTPTPGLLVNRPFNVGRVFFVDTYGPNASDDNEGVDPNQPLKTVAAAMALCTGGQSDYVMILDAWSEDTEPIVVDKERIHFIGINNSPMPKWVVMTPSTDESVFKLGAAANHTEIAGLNLGGGNTHGGLELNADGPPPNSPFGLWLHHIVLGDQHPGAVTPLYGIFNVQPMGPADSVIEDCFLYGKTNVSFGRIDSNGMLLYGPGGSIIRRNHFFGIPGVALQITRADGVIICDNIFSVDSNRLGGAITLLNCLGCSIFHNHANFGESNMGNSPWADDEADKNNWGSNWVGDAVAFPA